MNHGVLTSEKATSVSTPVVAESGVPFFIGTAPVQSADSPAAANIPVMATSWDEAVEQLGYSDDWTSYTLCECMYSQFKLYGCQPAIFLNVLAPGTHKEAVTAADMDVADHKVALPIAAIDDTNLVIKTQGGSGDAYVKGTDYDTYYSGEHLYIELISTGSCYSATKLNIAYNKVKPSVITATEISAGIEAVELCMPRLGMVPDILVAPGWSHNAAVAAIMDTKAGSVNGLFHGKSYIDADPSTVTSYSGVNTFKTTNNLTGKDTVLCWPMLPLDTMKFHMSVQLAGLTALVDTGNGDPHESPSNKNFKCDGACLADGTEVNLTHAQANYLNSIGCVTALNFLSSGWVAWGNYTACYPGNTDVKDYILPVSRVFDWVENTLIRTFWSKIDKPMTRVLIDNVVDSVNIWLNGLVGTGHLLGGRVELIDAENPLTNLMAGLIKLHVYLTPVSPAQEIHFVLEYDPQYVRDAFAS